VDYDEVFSRKQHLAQVVVTMYPRLHCANACFVNLTEALEDIIFKAQYAVGDRACFRAQSGKSRSQQIETLAYQLPQGGVERPLVVGCKRFWGKRRITIGFGRQRKMQLRRALTQSRDPLIKSTPNQRLDERRRLFKADHGSVDERRNIFFFRTRQYTFIKPPDGIDSHYPCIALVFHFLLHEGKYICTARFIAQFNTPSKPGAVAERSVLGKEPDDLRLRVQLRFNFPIELEKILVVVDDGGIALI